MKNIYLIIFITSLFLTIGCKSYTVSNIDGENQGISQEMQPDSIAENIILKYRKSLDKEMNVTLNKVHQDLNIGSPQGKLGNFVSDLTYKAASNWKDNLSKETENIDFALLNNGGLRVPLLEGDVTVGRVFKLMPFENEIVLVKISGSKMVELISYVVTKSQEEGRKSGVPISKELTITIFKDQPAKTLINGISFDSRRDYIIATSDYLANGGDKMDFFLDPLKTISTGIKLRDAIINEIRELKENGKTVNSNLDSRISYGE